MRILIIEDNRDSARSLQMLLRRYGHEVLTCFSGRVGLSAAQSWKPDAVLCDLGLPEISGFEIAEALRADPATADLRLIAVSGYGSPEDQMHSQVAGFDRHLTKPVNPAELLEILTDGQATAAV